MFVVVVPRCRAQTLPPISSSVQAEHKPEFEIASVRENRSGGKGLSNFPLDRGDVYYPTGGVFRATNQSVVGLLIFAYKVKITEFHGGLMRRLPGWAASTKFDIDARAASPEATKDDMRLMVQSLLEDRFKLKVHREEQQVPAFGLFLTKPGRTGPLLRPHTSSPPCLAPLAAPAAGTPPTALLGAWPPICGDGTEVRVAKYVVREGGRDMTMDAIADWLTGSGDLDRPILNRTGQAGTFDFILQFDPESLGREGISTAPHDDSGPPILEAMKEQLGLQVKKQDGSIRIFVVDTIAYPSAN